MSPGAGLRPTPPPLFRPQGHSQPRPTCVATHTQKRGAWLSGKSAIRSPTRPAGHQGEIDGKRPATRVGSLVVARKGYRGCLQCEGTGGVGRGHVRTPATSPWLVRGLLIEHNFTTQAEGTAD